MNGCGTIHFQTAKTVKLDIYQTGREYILGFTPLLLPDRRENCYATILNPLLTELTDMFINGIATYHALTFERIPAGRTT